MSQTPTIDAFIRQRALIGSLSFSAATLWRKVKKGTFPPPVKLSERVTAWRVSDVERWKRAQPAAAVGQGSPVRRTKS